MSQHSAGGSERSPHPFRRAVRILLAAAIATLVLAAGLFWLTGGRWFVVRTPSMGTAAPVGSLVLTRPTQISALHVGDVVAYHPPLEPGETYTHRIVAITSSGLRTRGDINGATDPWFVTQHDIVGQATAVPALGWLLRALPLLVIGGLVVWGLTRMWLAPAARGPARMLGGALLFSFAAVLLKPFVNVVQLATRSTPHGAYIQTVSTGLLPIRLDPANGHAAAVRLPSSGRVGLTHFTEGKTGEQYLLHAQLALTTWQWVLAVLVCAAPLLWTLLVGFRVDEPAHAAP